MARIHPLLLDIDSAEFRLLNDWQRGFPLVSRPFAAIGDRVGLSEQAVIDCYLEWVTAGVVSRVGAVFAPRRLGAGALVALAVPPARLDEVAARVSAEPGVNHNYEREHAFNLWFVASATNDEALRQMVSSIELDTGCHAIFLPMEEEFHIDLGFDLSGRGTTTRAECESLKSASTEMACALPDMERRLFAALQRGLPIIAEPWAGVGQRVGLNENMVIEIVSRALDDGLIRRFGAVVRHHELGIKANAMCVWDVPDELAGALGRQLARNPGVTLCYRRTRSLPHWPYNLFCMIHGSVRETVLAQRDEIARTLGLDQWPHAVLFSGRRFKQGGAHYLPLGPETGHG
ncbi:MAG: Lrp/AsnC family transcriptional regulator [Azoarcus sp.]|jgi:DNA-binding Lrp family transcriptional regulator|nr:Lrp/AsnC family transcriptional regulator [Azoarcus sp.]MDX9839209.1 Lrp/AsnC family transcriptional regulator [Azoarcus sp.]